MPLSVGTKLGPYEILAPIGKGGMGEVYRAHDPRTGRDVAIKVSAERFNQRFDREVRAVAALNHPNICTLFDVGPNYLVMELVEGEAPQGPLPLDEALRIARQIADALEAAHEKGITHRDLKPANIKVKPGGTVKVLDFGLAKLGGTPTTPSEDSSTISMAATQAGVILGTAAYMSPEQARGKPVDKRADIWAFGVVLYELVTGKRLFKADDITDTLAAVLKDEPDWEEIPLKVRRLLRSCLEKDPKKRLRDIGDAWRQLDDEPVTARPQSRLGDLAWVLAGMLAVALGALAWLHLNETPTLAGGRFDVTLPHQSTLAYLMLSPNGRILAFTSDEGGPVRIWLRPLDSLDAHPLAGTDNAIYPFWSPDSANLGFFVQGKLKKIAVAGGPAQDLCPAPTPRGAVWNRDGFIIFAPNISGGLYRVPEEGGVPTPLTKVTAPESSDSHRFPELLPGGKAFLYVYQTGRPEAVGIYAASFDGAAPMRILPDLSRALYIPLASGGRTGYLVFRRDTTLMALPFDPDRLIAVGAVIPLAEDVADTGNTGFGAFAASKNGVLLYREDAGLGKRTLAWLDRSGKRTPVTSELQALNTPARSPDGQRAAYSIRSSEVAGDIWIHDFDRGVPGRFTFGSGNSGSPVWSPDGSYILYVNAPFRTGTYDFYRKPSDSAGKEELLLHAGLNGTPYDISSDGKLLVYSQTEATTKDDLWLLPLTDKPGDPKPRKYLGSPFNETNGQFSPDGKWMAYVSDESGRPQVYVQAIPATGAKRQISSTGGFSPRWRRDGKELFYISADRKMTAVPTKLGVTTLDFGAPQPLFEKFPVLGEGLDYLRDFGYQPSADGKKFLAIVPAEGEASAPSPVTVWLNWQATLRK